MRKVWFVDNENLEKARSKLMEDELVIRQTLTIRDAKTLDFPKEGSFIYLEGNKDAIHRAETILQGIVKPLEEDETDEVISRIQTEEDNAAIGLGGIFG